jgi:membrane-associated phospholipid phosphatase
MVVFLAAYFLMLPVGGGVLYFSGRRREFQALMFNVALAYTSCFLLFLLFPAEGPWVIMKSYQSKPLAGGLLSRLYLAIQKGGSIRGGCFPSSHVAGAFAIALSLFRFHRKLAVAMTFVAVGVAVGVVYSRYHHGVDSPAGFLVAVVAVWVGTRIHRRFEKRQEAELKAPVPAQY